MSQPSHRLCPVCGVAFFAGEPVLQCSGCQAVHHPACWIEANGCATPDEHEGQPLPRTFGGVPPPASAGPPPAPRPPPAPPPASPPPPVSEPVPERRAVGRPRNIGSLDLDARASRSPSGLTRFWYVPFGFAIAAAIAFGIVWGIDYFRDNGGGDQPAAPATAVPATATTAPATPAPTATPPPATPQPTPTPAPTVAQPAARFSPGDSAVVAGTDSCLNVRAEADIEAQILDCLADGTNVTVLEGPVEQGNLSWWLIAAPEVNGWAAEIYLAQR